MDDRFLKLRDKFSLGKEEFVKRSKSIYGDKDDYSKVEYINMKTPVKIICSIHGEFERKPEKYLLGQGCPECSSRIKLTNENFIMRSKKIFGENAFDYSNIFCKTTNDNVSLKCCKCGKTFDVTPHNHLHHREGCPFCKLSKLEKDVEIALNENNIDFEQQKVFEWLIDGKKIKRLDFYIPKYNAVIECQGLQHFKPIKYFGGKEHFELQKANDKLKKRLCEEHGISVFYYSNKNVDVEYKVYTDVKDLIAKLKKTAESED